MTTDTDRLDFLSRQKEVPLWIGYDTPSWTRYGKGPWVRGVGHASLFIPARYGYLLREEIDRAMASSARQDWSAPSSINEVR